MALISLQDQLTVAYRKAWRDLWNTNPPVVRKTGQNFVTIVSEHGEHRLEIEDFRGRINDMRTWAAADREDA